MPGCPPSGRILGWRWSPDELILKFRLLSINFKSDRSDDEYNCYVSPFAKPITSSARNVALRLADTRRRARQLATENVVAFFVEILGHRQGDEDSSPIRDGTAEK
jgi:hypothetical protein